ncbi:MAG: hypothetical protein H6609_19300, partial [Ignavibacteriales bacterium]|nr:hypothetical protein [Ignavibacteriales bacterium]
MNKMSWFLFLTFFTITLFAQQTNIHHKLSVKISPETSYIEVVDEITISKKLLTDDLIFSLHENLDLQLLTGDLKINLIETSVPINDIGMDRDNAESDNSAKVNKYSISDYKDNSDLIFTVKYSGRIDSPIEQSEENYQRGFSESPGII